MITGLLIAVLVVAVLTLYLVAWYVHREVTATPEIRYEIAPHKPNGYHIYQPDGVATGANTPTIDFTPQQYLGSQVRDKRLALGLTQKELGKAWGMADSTVSNIEHGCTPIVGNPLVQRAIEDFLAHGLPETAAKK